MLQNYDGTILQFNVSVWSWWSEVKEPGSSLSIDRLENIVWMIEHVSKTLVYALTYPLAICDSTWLTVRPPISHINKVIGLNQPDYVLFLSNQKPTTQQCM